MIIPETEHTTIKRIYRAIEKRSDDGLRHHLGGSLIGQECEKSLWFTFRWCTSSTFDGRMLRLFETGQLAESRFVSDLRAAGVEIHDHDGSGKQYRVSAVNGHFGGSFDGVGRGFVEAPTKWHLVEMKTHNAKSFAQLKKHGVQESKPEHYAQMQVYMHLAKPTLQRAFYIAVDKDTDELYGERIEYDAEFAGRLIEKASRIIYASAPLAGISDNPEFFKCRMCTHYLPCYGYELPNVNCRTCAQSTPVDGGEWHCEYNKLNIPKHIQKDGCSQHVYHPDFLKHHAKPIDSGANWVKYEMRGIPDTFINGYGHYRSDEIKNAVAAGDITLLSDPNIQELKSKFGATIEVTNV